MADEYLQRLFETHLKSLECVKHLRTYLCGKPKEVVWFEKENWPQLRNAGKVGIIGDSLQVYV